MTEQEVRLSYLGHVAQAALVEADIVEGTGFPPRTFRTVKEACIESNLTTLGHIEDIGKEQLPIRKQTYVED